MPNISELIQPETGVNLNMDNIQSYFDRWESMLDDVIESMSKDVDIATYSNVGDIEPHVYSQLYKLNNRNKVTMQGLIQTYRKFKADRPTVVLFETGTSKVVSWGLSGSVYIDGFSMIWTHAHYRRNGYGTIVWLMLWKMYGFDIKPWIISDKLGNKVTSNGNKIATKITTELNRS